MLTRRRKPDSSKKTRNRDERTYKQYGSQATSLNTHRSIRIIDKRSLFTLDFDIDICERERHAEEAFNMAHIRCNGEGEYAIPLARTHGELKLKCWDDPSLQEALKSDIESIREMLEKALRDAIAGFGADYFIPTYRRYSVSPGAQPGAREESKKFVKMFSEAERARRSKRWRITKGGDRRSNADWSDPRRRKDFQQRVNELRPLWAFIKSFHKKNQDDDGWMSMLKNESHRYRDLTENCSDPDDLLRRVADENVSPRKREPLALALEHARRELNLPEAESETLRKYFIAKNH